MKKTITDVNVENKRVLSVQTLTYLLTKTATSLTIRVSRRRCRRLNTCSNIMRLSSCPATSAVRRDRLSKNIP